MNPHALQMELKKKMREATKAYGESLRKRNRNERKDTLEEDTASNLEGQELENTRQFNEPEQPETKGRYSSYHKPPSISSFTSTDQKTSNQSRNKNIRVSSNASIPYIGHQNHSKGTKKVTQLEGSIQNKEVIRGKSSNVTSKTETKALKRLVSEEKVNRMTFAIPPEFEARHPVIPPLDIWKKEEEVYIAKINHSHPLEPMEPIFLQICHKYFPKAVHKKEVKTGPAHQTSNQRSKSKSLRDHGIKESVKSQPSKPQNHESKEETLQKVNVHGKNLENNQGSMGVSKKNDYKKDVGAPSKPLSKTKTQKELKRTETKESLKQNEQKTENFAMNPQFSGGNTEEAPEPHSMAKPSVLERVPKPTKKTSRREEVGTEEQTEIDEKRAKINNQLEIWKATKGVPAQMRSTADLRSLLPAPLDYSDSVPTWGHLFSETYCHKSNQEPDILGAMRDVDSSHEDPCGLLEAV